MQATDRKAFGEIIEALAAGFRVEVTIPLLEFYWMGLEDLPLEQVREAAKKAAHECEHMPRPVELRRGAGVVRPADRAVQAFGEASAAIQKHGHRASVNFADKVINATLRQLGGWMRVCTLPSEEWLVWGRKDFIATYAALATAKLTSEAVAHLPGADEAENAGRFPDNVPAPVLVGGDVQQLEAPRVKLLGSGAA